MKLSDFIFKFKRRSGFASLGLCRVRLFANGEHVYVVITDLGLDNTGPSVTNSIEGIMEQLREQGRIVVPAPMIVEHYEKHPQEFSIVTFGERTNWITISNERAFALLGCNDAEFLTATSDIPQLQKQLVSMRNEINPRFGLDIYQDHALNCRLRQIVDQQKSKEELESLVCSGANERALQSFLKSDLSFFGEVYAYPQDEYICFSEFPIGDTGFAAFVVFSGTSRMDVWIIEVKGANFNLTARSHYEQQNAEISKAITQLQKRKLWIERNYADFRKHVHDVRIRAESGHSAHNAFVGPLESLGVDPAKDINCHFSVIGGRDKDDYRDSTFRTTFEQSSFVARLDTWDSFLRKLRR